MKKTLIILAVALMALTSCNKQQQQGADAPAQPTELKIAYVEVDSIMTQYNFCKDFSLILQKKGQNIQNTLQQKQQAFQQAVNNYQQKLQQNAYTREQAQAIEASLQKQSNDLQALDQRLSAEFQKENENFSVALRDSIQHFLAKYNKDKQYSLILSKSGDNLLYAAEALDITNEVITGLNKAYKKAPTDSTKVKK